MVLASKGYPEKYEKGYEITIPEGLDGEVFVAGAKLDGERLLTNGGRVLGAVAKGADLKEAVS